MSILNAYFKYYVLLLPNTADGCSRLVKAHYIQCLIDSENEAVTPVFLTLALSDQYTFYRWMSLISLNFWHKGCIYRLLPLGRTVLHPRMVLIYYNTALWSLTSLFNL